MSKVIFIGSQELKDNGLINGSVDVNKFLPYIEISQDIHIQNILGTDLYNRLKDGIVADDLNADEVILLDDYIKSTLIHFALAEYYPFAAYRITNGGIYKHTSENEQTIDVNEVEALVRSETSYAKYYSKRLVDYLCVNYSLYPEYSTNTDDDISPSKTINYIGGIYL